MTLDLQLVAVATASMREVARLAAGALVAGLWQGALLCSATWLILKTVPKSTATLRFVVWIAAFSVSVAMPFLNLPTAWSSGRAVSALGPHLIFDPRWSYLLAALWLFAAAYRLAELGLQAIGLWALWKSAIPVQDEKFAGLETPLAVAERDVELCTSDEVDRPSVIGFFAPRILIPTWLFAQLTPVELTHIVLHELEHLRRRDDWVNLLQKIGLVLLPLNPALFWIDRRLSTERELACDDGVLEQTGMPRAYAASLTSIVERQLEFRLRPRMATLALAAMGLRRKRPELGRRIESILGFRSPVNRVFVNGLAAVLVVGVVGSAMVLVRTPQLVSFGSSTSAHEASTSAVLRTPNAAVSAMPIARSAAPVARFQDVIFHASVKAKAAKTNPSVRRISPVKATQEIAEDRVIARSSQRQFVVLTSWEDAPVTPVVVQSSDGRVFLVPYAAMPTRAGWLLVQL